MAKYEIKDGVGIIPEGTKNIESWAFQYSTELTRVVIPDSVTGIGEGAFYGCTGLTSIVIPDSVTKIGNYVFNGCTGLTGIVIPNSVTLIDGAFTDCTGLTSIVIPDSVTGIGGRAFSGCTGLTSIVIPDSVTEIGSYAFSGCTGLTNIVVSEGNKVYDSRDNCNAIIETESNTLIAGCINTVIPGSVTEIGDFAFDGCTGLTSIVIPDSVTSIGGDAFRDCTGLTSIVIPDSVTKISRNAFDGCSALTSIVLPKSLTKIDSEAFKGCVGLTDIVIPESVTYIGLRAFEGCTGLTSIVISASVREIYSDAFNGCTGLTSIKVAEGNKFFDSRDHCNAVIDTRENVLITGCKNTQIPSSVFSIGRKAFKGMGIESITIPDNIVSIRSCCFADNESLESVTLGKYIKELGEDIFEGCNNLKRVVINVEDPTQIQIDHGVELGGYQATLCVPDEKGVLAAYKKKAIWKKFAAIETFAAETGQETAENDQWASFLELIGMKDSKLKLKPISPEYDIKDMLTVTYHVTEDMLPYTAILDDTRAVEMYVDDQTVRPFKKEVVFKKAGDHVIRIFARSSYLPHHQEMYEGSELIKIPDSMTEVRPKPDPCDWGTFNGSRKLLLGAGYNIEKFPEKDFEEIAVVPTNPYMETRNDCIVMKESQMLVYVPAKATALPEGIKSLKGYWILKWWSQPKLFIPGSLKSVELDLNKVGCAEEIEFGDGIQEVILRKDPPLRYEKPVESKVSRIILPKSVTSLEASDDLKKLVEKK